MTQSTARPILKVRAELKVKKLRTVQGLLKDVIVIFQEPLIVNAVMLQNVLLIILSQTSSEVVLQERISSFPVTHILVKKVLVICNALTMDDVVFSR